MRAIVHIGAPKTGSTSIQSFLRRNRDALRAQGFVVPHDHFGVAPPHDFAAAALAHIDRQLIRPRQRVHFNMPTLEAQKAATADTVARLADIAANAKEGEVALISSEHLMAWLKEPETVAGAVAFFKSHFSDVRYVMYFRPQPGRLLSGYSEAVKLGGTQTLRDFCEVRIREVENNVDNTLNYAHTAELWADAAGKDKVTVRLLERGMLRGDALIPDFAAECGINTKPLRRPPKMNQSLSREALELVRALNEQMKRTFKPGKPNQLYAALAKTIAKGSKQGGARLELDPDQADRLDAAVFESNERLRRAFFPDQKTLFNPRPGLPSPDMPPSEARPSTGALIKELFYRAVPSQRPAHAAQITYEGADIAPLASGSPSGSWTSKSETSLTGALIASLASRAFPKVRASDALAEELSAAVLEALAKRRSVIASAAADDGNSDDDALLDDAPPDPADDDAEPTALQPERHPHTASQ
ncbi:MAG: hypothetical protein AAFU80_08215 [Pseudomonadota bacterium]